VQVTIGIPTYNQKANYLKACLSSCNTQNGETEILILDDGSTLPHIIRKIAKEYNAHYIYQTNQGIGSARKAIAKNAKSELIAYLSSDDCQTPNYLESMLKYADGESILYSDYYQCNERLEVQRTFKAPRWQTQQEFRRLVLKWALESNMFTNFSTVMIPKKVFEQVQFDADLRFGEDLVFLLETLKAGISWQHIPEPLLYYRIHNQAGTKKGWSKRSWENLWFKLCPVLHDLGVSDSQINDAMCWSFRERFSWKRQVKNRIPMRIKSVVRQVKSLVV